LIAQALACICGDNQKNGVFRFSILLR